MPTPSNRAYNAILSLFFVAIGLILAGCATAPAQVAEDMEFARKAWREDRREDLHPRVIEAREAFFTQAIKTARVAAGKEIDEQSDKTRGE